jgi:choline kinase
MNGIILAAGRGSRLGSLTDDRPKCLLPVAGRTLLEWQTSTLRACGITNIAIVTGYGAQHITADGLTRFENPDWSRTNMVRSLQRAEAWLSSDACVVSYADIIYPASAVKALARTGGDVAITFDVNWLELWRARFDDPLSDAETFKLTPDGFLIEIGNKPATVAEVEGQYMGLLKFTPAGWAAVTGHLQSMQPQDVDRLDMTSLLRGLLGRGIPVRAVPVNEPWFEVDTERDWRVANEALLHAPGLSSDRDQDRTG